MKNTILTTICALLLSLSLAAQRPPRPSSPDVHPDHSITFRYYAPDAQQVMLHGEFLAEPLAMTKDDSGIWTAEAPPVAPDIYPYFFKVDGVQLPDPNNTYVFANERFKRSIVDIPGDQPLIHSLQNVPHGKIHYRLYNSATLNTTRELLVYTPPGFDPHDGKKYPVLYLIHGGSDTQETWTKVGKAHLIADNLIAQGKAQPMIIVMPYGNVRPSPMSDFTKDVIDDIIPFVEKNYPVIADSRHRAVAGFSVGGGQTLNIGLTNTDKFAYVCSYAPYTATEEFKQNFADWSPDAKKMNEQLELFTISVGTEDFLYESVKGNIAMFEDKEIELEPFIVSGGHTWMNCKLFLATTLQQLFKSTPAFSEVVYQGNDAWHHDYPLAPDEFYNPILQGCYPDPAITRKGEDYYLVCSSFAMFPGVPIFHSKDLVNWTQIGHVLDRPAQLDVHDTGISAGVYAPGITYNPNNDTFYMIVTAFAGGLGNIIVKTKDPKSGWSDPIKLKFGGIDPSIFFDDNGKAYIVHNDAPAKEDELYNGHRVIKIWEYDVEADQVIEGTDQIIVNGGVDITEKPIWIEAPHIYKKDGRYYLMCAEGGTGDWHSEVIFVSDNPKGPYEPAPNNPILTQRYFAKDRKNKVDWAGHADLVLGPDDKYYGVFLAIRPNEEGRVNIGRETFILPVDWSGEFPVFENGLIPLEPKLKMPKGVSNKTGEKGYFPNGNFTYREDFSGETLDYRWIGLRGPREAFISTSEKGLQIDPLEVNIKEVKPSSTLFYRQQHNSFSFTTTLEYQPGSEKDLAGIVCLQNERFNYVFGITRKGEEDYLLLQKTQKGESEIIAGTKIDTRRPVRLQVTANGDAYEFSYSTNGADFTNLGGTVSGDILSTNVARGFTGCLLGLYATSANDAVPDAAGSK